jgi:ABC-type Fe3+ transport system substrate-binding protein
VKLIKIITLFSLLAPAASFGAVEKLTFISPHQNSIRNEWLPAFKTWYKKKTGNAIKIEWLDQGGTSDDLRFVKSEFKRNPKGINIDIFWGGGIDPFVDMSAHGLLDSYRLPRKTLKKFPKQIAGIPLYDKNHRWYGAALSGFGIIYNKSVLKIEKLPAPKTWEDLARPEYFKKVSTGDPRHSGSAHMIYAIILQAYGWDKGWDLLTRMSGNVRKFDRHSAAVPKNVTSGEVVAGTCIDFYAWAQVSEFGSDRVGFVMPEGLSVINPDAIAILKGAPNKKAAKLFLQFVMSDEGQKLWMLPKGVPGGPQKADLGRMSVIPNLYKSYAGKTVVPFNPFEMKSSLKYDPEEGRELWVLTNDLMGTMLIDSLKDLQTAWKAIVDNGMNEAALKELTRMPVDKKTALAYSKRWKDSVFRNKKINEWVAFAKQKYKKAHKLAKK